MPKESIVLPAVIPFSNERAKVLLVRNQRDQLTVKHRTPYEEPNNLCLNVMNVYVARLDNTAAAPMNQLIFLP